MVHHWVRGVSIFFVVLVPAYLVLHQWGLNPYVALVVIFLGVCVVHPVFGLVFASYNVIEAGPGFGSSLSTWQNEETSDNTEIESEYTIPNEGTELELAEFDIGFF